jgi:hypothetical protein
MDKGEEWRESDCWRIVAPFPVCPRNKGMVEGRQWTIVTSASGSRNDLIARPR